MNTLNNKPNLIFVCRCDDTTMLVLLYVGDAQPEPLCIAMRASSLSVTGHGGFVWQTHVSPSS